MKCKAFRRETKTKIIVIVIDKVTKHFRRLNYCSTCDFKIIHKDIFYVRHKLLMLKSKKTMKMKRISKFLEQNNSIKTIKIV